MTNRCIPQISYHPVAALLLLCAATIVGGISCLPRRVGEITREPHTFRTVQLPGTRASVSLPEILAGRVTSGDLRTPTTNLMYGCILSSRHLGGVLGDHPLTSIDIRVRPVSLDGWMDGINSAMSAAPMPMAAETRHRLVPDPFLTDVVSGVPAIRDLTTTPLRTKYRYCFFSLAPESTLLVMVITADAGPEELAYADAVFDTVWRSVRLVAPPDAAKVRNVPK